MPGIWNVQGSLNVPSSKHLISEPSVAGHELDEQQERLAEFEFVVVVVCVEVVEVRGVRRRLIQVIPTPRLAAMYIISGDQYAFAAEPGSDSRKPKLIAYSLAPRALPIMCNHPSHSTNPALENHRQFRSRNALQKFSNTF
jgi:hypothetical protein